MKKILMCFVLAVGSLIGAPRAIVFDFGGVMVDESDREAVGHFIRESFHFTQLEFETANLEKRLAVKKGKSDEEFWLSYAQDHGVSLPPNWAASLKSEMKNAIRVNAGMYALVDQLRERRILVGMLSNISQHIAGLVRECGLYDPFEPCLLSCDIGISKPDPGIYEVLLTELDLPAGEVVFIDDRPENIEVAKKLGLDAILFESEDTLRTELSKRGVSKA